MYAGFRVRSYVERGEGRRAGEQGRASVGDLALDVAGARTHGLVVEMLLFYL